MSQKQYPDIDSLEDIEQLWSVGKVSYSWGPLIVRYSVTAQNWLKHPMLPVKLGFAIPLNYPNKGGLPHPEENRELDLAEGIICQEVLSRFNGIYTLALTTGKMKEFVFYIPFENNINSKVSEIHKIVDKEVKTHEVQCMAKKDPEWTSYIEFTS